MADPQAQDAHAALDEALEAVVLHDLAREVWDEGHGLYLTQVNADGSNKCADDCRGCAALALVRSRLVVLEQERAEAREILDGCLWDGDPWDGERLVELMERVYVLVGGSLDGPPTAVSVADIPQEDTSDVSD